MKRRTDFYARYGGRERKPTISAEGYAAALELLAARGYLAGAGRRRRARARRRDRMAT
jgi:hypothetical protein